MSTAPRPEVTAIVLCGGGSRRFGEDKTRVALLGRPVLDWLLDSLPGHWDVVCVGQQRPTTRGGVRWTREEPPGGGPAAALAVGLALATAPVVVLLGGDMPFAGPHAARLADDLGGQDVDGLVGSSRLDGLVGSSGPGAAAQPLLSAMRTEALRASVPDHPTGLPLRRVLATVEHLLVTLPAEATLDVDTPEDLVRAEIVARRLAP